MPHLFWSEEVFWFNLRNEVENCVASCAICCQTTKPRFQKRYDGILIKSTRPLQRLSLDFFDPKDTAAAEKK